MHEQKIYYGAPGTGKSHYVKEKISSVMEEKIFRITIHPEYTYSDFIGQLLPEQNKLTHNVEFPFKPGPFSRALKEAYSDSNKEVYLILEELSRGNVAAIFGDIFQLLDRDIYFVSKYPIKNENIAYIIPELITDNIKLPSNFNIIGTVNINDQNVFPMDTAFKRRFEWEYISSKPVVDDSGQVLKKLNNPNISISLNTNEEDNLNLTWLAFYTSLNEFITNKERGLGKNEDKQIGQFFIDFTETLVTKSHSTDPGIATKAKQDINNIIKNKLLMYLWNDVQSFSAFNGSNRIFNQEIRSFDNLYEKYGNDIVFSDIFIESFITPNLTKYPYH